MTYALETILPISLGGGLLNGTQAFTAAAGFEITFDAISDDEYLFQFDLSRNYRGQDLKLQIDYVLYTTSPTPGTNIQMEVDYYFFKDGEAVDPYTTTDGNNVDVIDVSSESADRPITLTLPSTLNGKTDATTLSLTLRRKSAGTTSDNYTNSVDIYGMRLIIQQ